MTTETEKKQCMKAEPRKEHEWLKKMVGEWTIEGECMMGQDEPPYKSHGKIGRASCRERVYVLV